MEAALIANTANTIIEPTRATESVARHCTGIAVWTECSQTAGAIALALEQDERFTVGQVCANLDELVAQIEASACPAALVDIDLQPTRTLRNLEAVTKRFPDTRFIVLSQKLRNELVLEAMQVGARHFLIKDTIVSDLGQVLRRLVSNGSTHGNGANTGPLVTVLSASGGCGATTVAVNLANELARLTSRGSLLIDLDTNYGGAASFLGLQGEYGIADVLARSDDIDPELIRSTALAFSPSLSALLSPASVDLGSQTSLEYARLAPALEAARHAYGQIVIDAARVPIELAAELVNASDATMLVFQLTVKDIAVARSMIGALGERGVSRDLIDLVANRYQKRRSIISLDEARHALGGQTIHAIQNDYRSAIKALNFGEPLAQVAPRSGLRKQLEKLAAQITKAYLRQVPAA